MRQDTHPGAQDLMKSYNINDVYITTPNTCKIIILSKSMKLYDIILKDIKNSWKLLR